MDPIVPLKELMDTKFPEQKWLVAGLVPASAITILSGAPGSFKTWTLLHMALSIASKEEVFGIFKTEQANVLIVDEENHHRLIQDRLNKLSAKKGKPVYFTPRKGFKVEDDEMIDNVILSCKTYGIKLVIIDSLIRIHKAEENSSREMAGVFEKLGKFVENGIAVLITQHNRKPGKDEFSLGQAMRGSSDILAAVDSHIAVTRKDKHSLTFTQTKQRFDEELEPFEVSVVVNEDRTQVELEYGGLTKDKETQAIKDIIYDLLRVNGQMNQKQIHQEFKDAKVKIGLRKLGSILKAMVEAGDISSKPGKGNETIYFLSQAAPST